MPILKPKNPSESGMSMLLIIIAIVGFLGAMRYVTMNMDQSNKRNKEVTEAFSDANHRRFVQQVVADDQLCRMTNFMEGIKGWSLTTPTAPIIVKDTGGFVDYSDIGVKGLKWPSDVYDTVRPATIPGKARAEAKVRVTSVVFVQPTNREVIKAEIRGKTYYRIPINVYEKGTANGVAMTFNATTIVNGTTVEVDEPIKTFVELNPDDGYKTIVACYKDVSPRSLCLDAGGDFDPSAAENKCLMPFQNPGDRKPGTALPVKPGSTAPSNDKGVGNRWNGRSG